MPVSKCERQEILLPILGLLIDEFRAFSASLVIFDETKQSIDVFNIHNCQSLANFSNQLEELEENNLVNWVASHLEPAIIPNTDLDDRWNCRPSHFQLTAEPKSAISMPVQLNNHAVGVVTLLHTILNYWRPDHIDLFRVIANIIRVMMQYPRFKRNTRVITEEMAGLSGFAAEADLQIGFPDSESICCQLFQNSLDGIFISSEDGRILDANPKALEMINVGFEELHQLIMDDIFISTEDGSSLIARLQNEGKLEKFEGILKNRSGQSLPVEVETWRTSWKSPINFVWMVRDITERSLLSHLREDVITMVYHDLRVPLSNIMSSLEAIMSYPGLENEVGLTNLLSIAIHSMERLRLTTNSLLEVSQLEAGALIGPRNPYQVKEIFDEVLNYLEPAIHQKRLELEPEIIENLPEIEVDVNMIRRVLINLIENAVKYSPPESKIWIGARNEENFVCLWVKDSGPGIQPIDQSRVFEKFTRLNPDNKAGLGLGLAFCRAVIQAHGGRIWVESEPNCGSTFWLTLPVFYDLIQND